MTDKQASDSFEYEDTETWKGRSDEVSIKEIALKLFQKALAEGSKEMTQGGIVKRVVEGQTIEIIAPNQREIFVNSVQAIHCVLVPHIESCRDDDVKTKFQGIDEELKTLEGEFKKKYAELDKANDTRRQARRASERNVWSEQYNQSINELNNDSELAQVVIYKKKLQAISYLLFAKKYFEEATSKS